MNLIPICEFWVKRHCDLWVKHQSILHPPKFSFFCYNTNPSLPVEDKDQWTSRLLTYKQEMMSLLCMAKHALSDVLANLLFTVKKHVNGSKTEDSMMHIQATICVFCYHCFIHFYVGSFHSSLLTSKWILLHSPTHFEDNIHFLWEHFYFLVDLLWVQEIKNLINVLV